MVLLISLSFVPSSSYAVQWTVTPNHIGSWTSQYSYFFSDAEGDSGTVSGNAALSYESQRVFNANIFYLFNGAPFNLAEAHQWYSLDVTMRDIHIQPDASDNDFWIKFNFALCNRNTVKSLDDVIIDVKLLNANGLEIQSVDYSIKDNIVYCDDTFKHVSAGFYKIRISFVLGRTNSTPDIDFSDYTRFGITQIVYGRNDDISDVITAINGDGVYENPAGDAAMDNLNNYGAAEEEIMDSLPESEFNFDPVEILEGFNGGFPVVSMILNSIINHKAVLPIITFILALGLALFILGRRLGK